jgi:hypothetical protein
MVAGWTQVRCVDGAGKEEHVYPVQEGRVGNMVASDVHEKRMSADEQYMERPAWIVGQTLEPSRVMMVACRRIRSGNSLSF